MIIDVHTHFMTCECWGNEWSDNWEPIYGFPFPEVTAKKYDGAMKDVDVAIVFGMRATAANVATPNEKIAEFCKETKTKTIGFMALDPNDSDVLEQMQDGIRLGLRGIKLYPVLAHFDPRDTKFESFFREAQKNELVLLWHVGATPSPPGDLSISQPLVIDDVARRFPGLTQIMAHLGHPWQRETIAVLRKNRRVFADISGSWARPFDGFHALVRAQEWSVTEKLLFGSDFPLWTPRVAMDGLYAISELRSGTLPYVHKETIDQIINQDSLTMLKLSL